MIKKGKKTKKKYRSVVQMVRRECWKLMARKEGKIKHEVKKEVYGM